MMQKEWFLFFKRLLGSKTLLLALNLIIIMSVACTSVGLAQRPLEVLRGSSDTGQNVQAAAIELAAPAEVAAMYDAPLGEPLVISHHAEAGLHVVEKLPRPGSSDVHPESALVVTFDQPVVPLADDGSKLPSAFNIQPAAEGHAKWLNTSTYIFYPDPPLTGGIEYTVTLNAGLTSTVGAGLADADAWSFTTAAPRLLSIEPDEGQGNIDLDASFTFAFNQRMDVGSLQQNLLLQDGQGNRIAGSFAWEQDNTLLTFRPAQELKRDAAYKLILRGQAVSAGGTRLGESLVKNHRTVPILDVESSEPSQGQLLEGYFGYSSLTLMMTAPLAPRQDLKQLVQVSPSVVDLQLTLSQDQRLIFLSGYFEPDQRYTVSVAADLQDRWGQPAAGERRLSFRTAPAQSSLNLPMLQAGENTLFLTPDETSFSAQATNLRSVDFESASLALETFFRLNREAYLGAAQEWIPDLRSWQMGLSLPANRSTVVELPVSINNQPLRTGLYYFDLRSAQIEENYLQPRPFLAVVSPLNLTLKRSSDEIFLWAVDLRNETPAAGKPVEFYDKWMNPLGQAVTGQDGTCRLALPAELDLYEPVFAVVGRPGDEDFSLGADNWTFGTSGWYFGIPNWLAKDRLYTYLYTDRPIYRPGQTVNFRLVMRQEDGGGYALPPGRQVTVQMLGEFSYALADQPLIGATSLVLSSYGSAAGSITLPEDAAPGRYNLRVDEDSNAWLEFQVAEYRKPEIDLQVNFSRADWLSGEDIRASVQADYFFGAPAGDVLVHWALYARPQDFNLPSGYQSGVRSLNWLLPGNDFDYFDLELGEQIAGGTQSTAANGSLQINLDGDEMLAQINDNQSQHILTLEVSLLDGDEMPVSTRQTVRWHPAGFYIGMRSEAWSGRAGVETGFRIQTTDWQKAPSGGHLLQAMFQKVTFQESEPVDWRSDGLRRQPVYTTVSSADLMTDALGRARLAFTPPEPGLYVLKVFGEGAASYVLHWVSGSAAAQWPNLPNQQLPLTADKPTYRPGDVARILIPNPLGDKNLALITVEREKVLHAEWVEIQGGSLMWELPLEDRFASNVFVAVTLVGQQADGRPDFRQGYLELIIEPVVQTLEVELLTTPTYSEPGGEVSFDLQVRDSYGQPVQGEFSIAVVDKAVLALADSEAPDILTAFYSSRPLRVSSSSSLSIAANRIPLISADGRGGGGGAVILPPNVREDFPDTAFWLGSLETDANGIASVTMTLPDNLTTWVADLRGITRDSKVGSAGSEIMVSKPLLIRPQTPRFFVAGDHSQLRAIVHNNTVLTLDVEASIQAAGVVLDEGSPTVVKLTLSPGARQTVSWWGTIQEVDEVSLVFQAQSGGLQDAARPQQGMLPVLRYQVPLSFVTAGVLPEAGEQMETIQMPLSYTPSGGSLQVELAPSLAASILSGLEALEVFPYDFTEPILSHMLPNVEMYRALQDLKIETPGLKDELQKQIDSSLQRLLRYQNKDGGWGWMAGQASDEYITAYVLFGLVRAQRAGILVPPKAVSAAAAYLADGMLLPQAVTQDWQLDRQVFLYYALQQAGTAPAARLDGLVVEKERLNPWAKALLALMLNREDVGDQRTYDLLSDLQSTALRSASGAHWEEPVDSSHYNFSTANFNTAVVVYAIAQIDPASPLLRDGLRYLVAQRQAGGGWASSYESAWVLLGLTEAMKSTADLSARYAYSAALNGHTLLSGSAESGDRLLPVTTKIALTDLLQQTMNELRIRREAGSGQLYYRAVLTLERPAEEAEASQNGFSISRSYHGLGENCRPDSCPAISSLSLGSQAGVAEVRLTLTLPQEMAYLVVEDFVPAGAEIIDPRLKTSQAEEIQYDFRDPFGDGWGWWYFTDPQIYDDHVRWIGRRVPAGTYVLTYRLQAVQAGEYRVLPALAYEYYFPDVQGITAGKIFTIKP